MNIRYVLTVLLASAVSVVSASDKMSLALKLYVKENLPTRSDLNVPVMASVKDGFDSGTLEKLGISVGFNYGTQYLLYVPFHAMESLSGLEGISYMDLPQQAFPNMNYSRAFTGVDQVHEGIQSDSEIIPYTGKGVLVGVVDCGIQPSHITFLDKDQKYSRIKRFISVTGAAESESGEFEANHYETAEEIAKAPEVAASQGHGTHTASIAAGAYMGNKYYGNAYDADLFLVEVGASIYDDEMIYGMKEFARYASETGKPAVINYSIGSSTGPHDGTSAVSMAFEELVSNGFPATVSAGNIGNVKSAVVKRYLPGEEKKPFTFGIREPLNDAPPATFYNQIWSGDSGKFKLQLSLVSASRRRVISTSPEIEFNLDEDGDSELQYIFHTGYPDVSLCQNWLDYLTGSLSVHGIKDERSGRFAVEMFGQLDHNVNRNHFIAVTVIPEDADEFVAYSNAQTSGFSDLGVAGFLDGTTGETISDYACTSSVISVGMVNTTPEFVNKNGETIFLNNGLMGDLHSYNRYSSYGSIKARGEVTLPDVVAPGTLLTAAFSSNIMHPVNDWVLIENINGTDYGWGVMSGTSMSAPNVAGIIALWLEANPDLTPSDIKRILAETSFFTDEMSKEEVQRCRLGAVNAYDGLKKVLLEKNTNSIAGVVADNQKLMIRFLSSRKLECVLDNLSGDAEYIISGMDGRLFGRGRVSSQVFEIDNLPEASGVYNITVRSDSGIASQKLILR